MELEKFNPNASVRRILDQESGEIYFAVVDVIEVLTDSPKPRDYWYRMKEREKEAELSTICRQFPLKHKTNKRTYQVECATREGILRIIQSIPSKKAEPFKLWLASVGEEALRKISEIRAKYKKKGYDEDWINARIENVTTRNDLTDYWDENLGEKEIAEIRKDMAVLTGIIHRTAFEITIKDHKTLKGLKSQNLRDEMTRMELILSTLAEEATLQIAQVKEAEGFDENKDAAEQGGGVARNARKEIEVKTGRKVVSSERPVRKRLKG